MDEKVIHHNKRPVISQPPIEGAISDGDFGRHQRLVCYWFEINRQVFSGARDLCSIVKSKNLNVKFRKVLISEKVGCLVGGLLFGFILPLISQFIEIKRVQSTIGIIDNFEVLYTYLRFPTYWFLWIIQLMVFGKRWKPKARYEVHETKEIE